MMQIYLVGGAVRDKLLQLPVTDKDWVIVGATPEELLQQGYQQVGNQFPVFLHPQSKEEYALARTERKSGKGYTGFACDFNPTITLEDDLLRRDLTINAMAENIKGELIDPYQGLSDLKQKILRHISPAFCDDPLRVLRVARFAARFHHLGFHVAAETIALMKNMASNGEINYLKAERVWRETEKALQTDDPQIYFSLLHSCGALSILLPDVANLFHIPATDIGFPDITYGQQMLLALKKCATLTKDTTCRFAILCCSINKTFSQQTLTNDADIMLIDKLCHRIKIPIRFRNMILSVYRYGHTVAIINTLPAKKIVQLFNSINVWQQPERLTQLIMCSKANYTSWPNKENDPFPQADYLIRCYHAANAIKPQTVIANGYTGAAIQNEINIKRTRAIEKIQSSLSHP